MKKILRYTLIALAVLLVAIQFIRPEKNLSGDETNGIATKYPVPADVQAVLKVACNDCHTNKTEYPWYANVQPFAWWIGNHIEDGKRHLNFSDFTSRRIAIQNHKLEEVIDEVKEHEMPLASYTWIHRDAVLTDAQRELLISWAEGIMDNLKATYPPDSLVMPKRGPRPPGRD